MSTLKICLTTGILFRINQVFHIFRGSVWQLININLILMIFGTEPLKSEMILVCVCTRWLQDTIRHLFRQQIYLYICVSTRLGWQQIRSLTWRKVSWSRCVRCHSSLSSWHRGDALPAPSDSYSVRSSFSGFLCCVCCRPPGGVSRLCVYSLTSSVPNGSFQTLLFSSTAQLVLNPATASSHAAANSLSR